MNKSPLIIAHRGFWKAPQATQNSLRAVQAAIDHKIDGVEIDLRMSKDQVLFLQHNTIRKGCFIHHTKAEKLRQLPVSPHETLATFDEFIRLVGPHTSTQLFIELKSTFGVKRQAELVTQVVNNLQYHQLINRTIVLSFNQNLLQLVQQQNTAVQSMQLIERPKSFIRPSFKMPNTPWIGIDKHYALSHFERIKNLQQTGIKINVWTVDNLDEARQLAQIGVEAITTNFPLKLKTALLNQSI